MGYLGNIIQGAGATNSGIIGTIGGMKARDAANAGYAGAISTIEPERNRLRDFINTEYATSQGIRDLGSRYADASGQVLPSLIESAQNPTVTPGFQRTAAEGLKAIQQNFATGGSAGSGSAQIAAGRFMTGLGDAERQRQTQAQQFMAGLSAQSPALSAAGNNILQLWPELNQMTGNLASIRMGRGLSNAGFYNNMAQTWQSANNANANAAASMFGGGGGQSSWGSAIGGGGSGGTTGANLAGSGVAAGGSGLDWTSAFGVM